MAELSDIVPDRPSRPRPRSPAQLIALTFLAAIVLGALLLWLPSSHAPGASVSFLDALFTATSAVCVTGLAVFDIGSTFNRLGQLIVLLLVQLGGLGVLTFGALVALVVGRRLGIRSRLTLQSEVGGFSFAEIVPLLRAVLFVALGAELIGALLLWAPMAAQPALATDPSGASAAAAATAATAPPAGLAQGAYLAAFHSVSAFNNAGISLYPDSLNRFSGDALVNLTVCALAIIGSLGFMVIVNLFRRARQGRRARVTLHTRLVLLTTAMLSILAFAAVLALEWYNPATLGELPAVARPLAALFQGVASRTAGFSTVDVSMLRPVTLFVLLPLMFIGGSPGSTAGGIKTVTFVVMVGSAWSLIRGHGDLTLYGRRIPSRTAVQASAIALLGILLVGGAVTMLLVFEPQLTLQETLFETVSAFATAGLSTGVTPELGGVGRLVLVFLMYLGRLGPLTLGLALMQQQDEQLVHYPREEVLIG